MNQPQFDFDTYLSYEEITEQLRQLSREYPSLMSLDSMGKSYEGRNVWVVTVTDERTGPAEDKPAHYIDANHHAGEVTGSMVALYLIRYLLVNYKQNDQVTNLVSRFTHYIVPRISPDGSEKYLTSPHSLRSSVRLWPAQTEQSSGLQPEDINGDGKILQMRVPDQSGGWKISDKDPRLMVKRDPDEEGGEYYNLYTEGMIKDYDGVTVESAPPRWGIDLNRNYPANWKDSRQQSGAGPYPLSEPETYNVAEFFADHPNISAATSFHTTGGIYLRPPCVHSDAEMNMQDLGLFTELGRRARNITGYPCESVWDAMTMDKKRPNCGSFVDFAYEMHGIVVFAPELWNLYERAGVDRKPLKERFLMSPQAKEEQDLKVLNWLDENVPGAFHDWTSFEHPQLGEVEIGGIEGKFDLVNPPVEFLAQECHKNAMAALSTSAALPMLKIDQFCGRQISDTQIYVLTAAVHNCGWLGTSATSKGRNIFSDGPEFVLHLPERVELIKGDIRGSTGHLAGRSTASERTAVKNAEKIEWVVKGTDEDISNVKLEIKGERAGSPQKTLSLD